MATPNNTAIAQNTIQYDLSGVDDPTLIATEASPGSTYRLLRNGSPRFYLKIDEGKTTNWLDISTSGGGLTGATNIGLGSQILKNILLGVLQLRTLTNDNQISLLQNSNDIQIGLTRNERATPVSLTTNSNVFETIFSYNMPLNQAEKIGVKIVGRKDDGTEHCLFERVGLFYNETGTVVPQRFWHTTTTLKSQNGFDIQYQISGSTINIQVKSFNTDTFYWKGDIYQIALNTP